MKRHYIAGLFCLIYAGLSFYQGFHEGEISRPIWTGIALGILGILVFLRDKLSLRLKHVVGVLALILMGVMVIKDFITEVSVGTIVGGMALIYVGAVAFFHDRPFVESGVRSWSTPFAYVVMGVLLILKLLTVYAIEPKKGESVKGVGEMQKPSVSSAAARNSDLQVENRPVLSDLQEKAMNILASEEVKQEIQAAAATGTKPEFLKSFSNFKDYMVSKGVTEFAILDQAPAHYQDLFQKLYPGKTPSDLDSEMRQRLINMIQEFGYEEGRIKFLRTPEIAVWTAARFNLLSDNPGSISAWTTGVYTDEFGDTPPTSVNVTTPSEAIPADGTASVFPIAEKETVPAARGPSGVEEDFLTSDTVDQDVTPPADEPERIVTEKLLEPPTLPTGADFETSLKERFSSERFERAMSTLDQYGREEGLRRLKEDDPEVAEQVERHRNRKSRTEDSR